jgi:hypothetical protein
MKTKEETIRTQGNERRGRNKGRNKGRSKKVKK